MSRTRTAPRPAAGAGRAEPVEDVEDAEDVDGPDDGAVDGAWTDPGGRRRGPSTDDEAGPADDEAGSADRAEGRDDVDEGEAASDEADGDVAEHGDDDPGRRMAIVGRLRALVERAGTERVLAVVALLGVVGTLAFGFLWVRDVRDGRAETAMADQAEEFLLALTNFDAATVDEDFDAIVDAGTGDFQDQADEFFGSEVRSALREVQASSRGEVRDLYVQSFDGDSGRVFAVVDQTIANNRFPQPQSDQLRVELALDHEGGGWKVSDVIVLEAPAAAGATPTVDGAAAGGGTEGEAG